jgi:hypothetical protein
MPLSKDAILSADDSKIETVNVPEWGGTVCVRGLKGWERDRFDQFGSEAQEKKDLTHWRAKLVSLCLCDETGKSLDFSPDEMIALSGKSANALDRVFDACRRLSGLTKQDEDDAEKN